MAAARRRTSGSTELAAGDLLVWRTKHGNVLVWVLTVLQFSRNSVVLELLDWAGEELPAQPRRLAPAPGAPPRPARQWFVGTDLLAANDPGGAYARVERGFTRDGFVPTKESKHGLHAPYLDRARITAELTAFAYARTPAGTAEAARAERAAETASAARAKARAAAKKEAAALLRRAVTPWSMPKPRGSGSREQVFSLTGKDSHRVWFPPGVGNMSVGPRPARSGTPHAVVGAAERLYWDALDALPKTGGGSAMPRWLRYEGADAGIFAWLARREDPLERLELCPTASMKVEAGGVRVNELVVELARGATLTIVLAPSVRVSVEGDAKLFRGTTTEGRRIAPRVVEAAPSGPHVFAGWAATSRGLATANRALVAARRALEALDEVKGSAASKKPRAREILETFVDALNTLHASKGNALFTLEREDVAMAIEELFAAPSRARLADDARAWFDGRRDF